MGYPSPVPSIPPYPLDPKVVLTNFYTWISNDFVGLGVDFGFWRGGGVLVWFCWVFFILAKQFYALGFLWRLVLVNVHVFDIPDKYSLFVALKRNNSGLLLIKAAAKRNWTLCVPEGAFILYQLSLQEKWMGLCQTQSGRVFLHYRKERGLGVCLIT